mmetsp:Transcript_3511/g.7098  ORF Transcript_3511/g.7098 Transcript_3511/m.7098 type:complete len:300 (-) Transcript_3511:523-1422(-)|eukprot:CAMPEP_0181342702 /NCGR_PEP_ID=MMETSP1101-20121128/31153_1 /TAXON_ID=46948 /ORGANISM="Rhodomonas abbreviata, Strain Caron Lab Isolate" /LENGTH=299 /DNA_ID=CAMNT_0023454201 /DNA_START=184 /DNA_END=1083 /DNA_ORIENTATION=+
MNAGEEEVPHRRRRRRRKESDTPELPPLRVPKAAAAELRSDLQHAQVKEPSGEVPDFEPAGGVAPRVGRRRRRQGSNRAVHVDAAESSDRPVASEPEPRKTAMEVESELLLPQLSDDETDENEEVSPATRSLQKHDARTLISNSGKPRKWQTSADTRHGAGGKIAELAGDELAHSEEETVADEALPSRTKARAKFRPDPIAVDYEPTPKEKKKQPKPEPKENEADGARGDEAVPVQRSEESAIAGESDDDSGEAEERWKCPHLASSLRSRTGGIMCRRLGLGLMVAIAFLIITKTATDD